MKTQALTLSIILASLCVLFGELPAAEPARKPNIVFILADDLGWMDLGCYGSKFYETPVLDGLAKSGMRFTTAYAACSVCSPTRASIMTGKYPPRVHITNFLGGHRNGKLLGAPYADHLALEEVTIAEAMRDAGYTNFFAGKWHLGDGKFSPSAQGFGPLIGTNQFYYPHPIPPGSEKDDPKTSDLIANEAVRFIEANHDKPFFAYLPFQAVHVPIGARRDLVEKYKTKAKSFPPAAWGKEGKSKLRLVQNEPTYAAMLEQLDSNIGRVLAALKTNGVADRTIVVFMSDNGGLATAEGWPTANLPLRGGKGWPYEGGVREPMIVSAPGVKPGSVCVTPVISTDFYPTLLELAGLPPMPAQHCDGVSFAPLLKGGTAVPERPLFWHYPHYSNQGGGPSGAVRLGDFKLVEWFEDMRVELFNLKNDLGEQHDLANELPGKTAELKKLLHGWRAQVGAVMPLPNPKHTVGTASGE